MIPLHDIHKPKRPPFITRLLITLNMGAFLYQCFDLLTLGKRSQLVSALGVRPACYMTPSACGISLPDESGLLWQPIFASLFLHGGFLHLAFNMLFLWVFGPGVEDRLGRWRFTLFYFGCGITASLTHIATHAGSTIPVIGASGAIAGVLGMYLILLPRSWILTYFPPVFLFPVPAPLFLVAWILFQIISGFTNIPGLSSGGQGSDIAWMAHIGGFLAGAAIGWTIKPWWKRKAKKT